MRSVLPFMILALAALPAPAGADSPCGPGYGQRRDFDLRAVLAQPRGALRGAWGLHNIQAGPAALRVAFPAGSINPGNPAAPVGGAGFLLPVAPAPGAAAEARCLRYRLRVPPDFDWARGGKLPGLFGGDAPRGCTPAELARGFSARLMWREGGQGELYLYAPDRAARCGESIGRSGWRIPRGEWVAIAQEVVLNRPGQADGAIRIWLDGRLVVDRPGLVLREEAALQVEGLVFATFFGGSTPAWASPRDQWMEFGAFELWEAQSARPGPPSPAPR